MSQEKGPFEVAAVVEYLETNDPFEIMTWGDHLRAALAEVDRLRAEVQRLSAVAMEAIGTRDGHRAPSHPAVLADLRERAMVRTDSGAEIDRLRALVPAPKTRCRPWRIMVGEMVWQSYSTLEAAEDAAFRRVPSRARRGMGPWSITNRLTGERIDLGPDGRSVKP